MRKGSLRIVLGIALAVVLAILFAVQTGIISSQRTSLQPFKVIPATTNVAFSPDGTTLALGGKSIRLWDLTTFTERFVLPYGGDLGTFSPDSHLLAIPGHPIRVWDLKAQRELPLSVRGSPEFSQDSSLLYALNCNSGSTTLDSQFASYSWDMQFGGVVGETKCETQSNVSGYFSFGGDVSLGYAYLVLSPDKRLKAQSVTFPSFSLQILDATTGTLAATLPDYFGPVAFSPDGKILAVADMSASLKATRRVSSAIHLFAVDTWQEIALLEGSPLDATQGGKGAQLVFSPDNRLLACACYADSVSIWKLDSLARPLSITLPTTVPSVTDQTQIKQLTLDRLARYGTVVQSSGGKSAVMYNDVSMWLYQLRTPQRLPQPLFQGKQDYAGWPRLRQVTFTPDKTIVAAVTSPGTITLWDTSSGKTLYELRDLRSSGPVWALSPDGTQIVAVDTDGLDGHVWDVQTGAEIASWQADQGESAEDHSKLGLLQKMVFSPDGKLIALSSLNQSGISYSQARLIQIPSGKKLALFTTGGMSDEVSLGFSADGTTLTYGANSWQVPEH